MTTTASLDLERLQATIREQDPVPTGTVSFIDRLAMRAGLKLVLWSRSHTAQHVAHAPSTGPRGARTAVVREHISGAVAAHDRETARIDRVQRPFF